MSCETGFMASYPITSPTHLRIDGIDSIEQVRDELFDVLTTRQGAVPYSDDSLKAHPFYVPMEVIVEHENILFVVKFWKVKGEGETRVVVPIAQEGTGFGTSFIIEFHKLRGDTIKFCNLYRWLVLYCSSTFTINPESADHVDKWLKNSAIGLDSVRNNALELEHVDMDLEETFCPMVAHLTSPWYESQIQMITSVACISENQSYARAMARHPPMVRAVCNLISVPQRDIVRITCTCIINMFVWQADIPWASVVLPAVDKWLVERADDPRWTHALKECRRLKAVAKGGL